MRFRKGKFSFFSCGWFGLFRVAHTLSALKVRTNTRQVQTGLWCEELAPHNRG
ncbi:hypothetical protein PF008_g7511 [Phytophthora fragariae]|uniref:Uncharacterized protein n=1 Tax=Phytophthora fragariae TaxID=53985 RepID=A0A6G0S2V5_9STRA|nr:hypothetical protein PF008_g7511 [Phytophthora fragariae]